MLKEWISRYYLSKSIKLLFLILIFSCATVFANNSRDITVTLKLSKASLIEVFDELESISGLKFLYNADVVKSKGVIDLEVNQQQLNILLENVLTPRGLSYVKSRNQIIIKRLEQEDNSKSFVIKGIVKSTNGETLPGTTIKIEGTSIGTVSNTKGEFQITVTEKEGYLIFSFIGYKDKKVKYHTDHFLEVKLQENVSKLDEVTVIGYGQRNKRELVSSISSVKADDIKEVPSASLETLLQGRMAGLGIQVQSGAPGGGGSSVAIRGYNSLLDDEASYKSDGSPLYVIDGVPVHSFTSPITGTNTIAEIDPSTIESIEVLKDAASAAIYGSRAANGVILITTKKGIPGRGKFSANFSYSGSFLPKTPTQIGGRKERLLQMAMMQSAKTAYYDKLSGQWKYPTSMEEGALNGAIYNSFWNFGMGLGSGGSMKIIQDSLNPFYNNSTNWFKYIFRPGKILNANLQTSGGSENVTYLIGGGFYKEVGIMPGSDFIRGNVLTNLSVNPIPQLSIDSRFYLAYTDRSRGQGGGGGGKIESMTITPEHTSTLLNAGGPVEEKMLQMMNGQIEDNTSYRLRGNLVLAYEVISGLQFSVAGSCDFNQMNQNFFRPNYLDPTYKESKSSGTVTRDLLLTNENLLTYTKTLGNYHNIDLLAGFALDYTKNWEIAGHGLGSPSNRIIYVGSGFSDMVYSPISDEYRAMQMYRSDFTETSMISYFGRIAYNYDKRYLVEATVRRDGSSVFGADVRWATFPSIAMGWAFSEEQFMRQAWWLDFAKIRASWGRTGSQFGIPYLAQGLMEAGSTFDGIQGMRPAGVINRKLQWEEADQYDIGLDVDLLEYRLSLTLDYYYKYTRSLIYKVPLPGDMYGEAGIQWQNAMAVSNEGLELEAKWDILRDKAVSWRMRFNISKNWNLFRKSYSRMDMPDKIVGKGLSGIYLFKDKGIIQHENDIPFIYDEEGRKHYLSPEGDNENFYTVGMRLIEDLDGDGQITEDDMYYAGSALPDIYGGIAFELKWKYFDLNTLFTYTIGRNIVNMFTINSLNAGNGLRPIFGNISEDDFWSHQGDDACYPAAGIYPKNAWQYSGLVASNLEKVNYLKLKQVTLGYNLAKSVTKKIGIDGIRFFVTGENLLTFTNYSGVDPELVNVHSGIDASNAYPLAQKWTVGITVNF